MELPKFKYHPDPLATGSIKPSDAVCICCHQARGHIYTGSVLAEKPLEDCICPWCIANGEAHEKLDAEFTDFDAIGDYGVWDDVPDAVREEVATCTPGFAGWQQERWWTHCGDAAEFLGSAGRKDVEAYGPELMEALRVEADLDGAEWDIYLQSLSKTGSPTAYVFRCRHCGKLGGYSDSD